jgi:hypothetical protein
MLESLPHVGSILPGADHERVTRLLTFLRQTIDDRAVRYSRASASTITDFRRLAEAPDETRIIVLVDGWSAFRATYETGGRARWLDLFTALAADGRPVGVHFVISVDQRTGMSNALASAVQSRVVLRMAHADDYGFLGVAGDVLTSASPPGRGLHKGAEIQCAVLGGTGEVMIQSRAVSAFGEEMRRVEATIEAAPRAGTQTDPRTGEMDPRTGETDPGTGTQMDPRTGETDPGTGTQMDPRTGKTDRLTGSQTGIHRRIREAPPIRSLTRHVLMENLPAEVDGLPVLGIGSTSLSAMPFQPRGSFVVTSPSGSGRTTTLASLSRSLHRSNPAMMRLLLTPRRFSELAALPGWTQVAAGIDDVVALAGRLRGALDAGANQGPMAVLVERMDDLAGTVAEAPLCGLVKACLDRDSFVVAEGETIFFSSGFGLPGLLKTSRSGLVLQPDGTEGQTVFRSSFPAFNRVDQPEGRGFLVQRGRAEMLQVALPE